MYENDNEINKLNTLKKSKSVSPLNFILDWAESFAFAIFVVILVFTFLLRTVIVVGKSMNPNFYDSDRIIITHINSNPEKGDVLVMNCYGLNETIIKRCIGTGGDKIVINYNDGTVKVNDETVSNEYINGSMVDKPYYFDQQYRVADGVYEYHVPEGKVFVMGDNRNYSSDSRCSMVGFIDVDDILGKVVFRIYPFDSIGKVKTGI